VAKVFISYRSTDRAKAASLAAALEDNGHEVWWDKHLAGGDDYKDKIDEYLTNADAIVMVLTENVMDSNYVRSEIQVGLKHANLIPVRYVRGVRGYNEIRNLHAEFLGDWDGKPRAEPIGKLVARINDLKSLKDQNEVLELIPFGMGDKLRRTGLVAKLFDVGLPGGLRVHSLVLGALVCALAAWAALFMASALGQGPSMDLGAFLLLFVLVVLSRALDQFVTVGGGGYSVRFFDRSFSFSLLVCGLTSVIVSVGNTLVAQLSEEAPSIDVSALVLGTVALTVVLLLLSCAARALFAAGRILQQRI